MTGHILLFSCLLAICLPIIFVQLSRFATIRELRAENEAETRSEVPRRRPPPQSKKTLRWITRPWSETDIDITRGRPEQKQIKPEQAAQASGSGRWNKGSPRLAFGADACADGGASSAEEELRKARAGKKPWDPPFRRQPSRTGLARNSSGSRWHAVTDAPLPRKTGREMEARGVAVRLFPPDPVPETVDADECNWYSQASPTSPQTSQELLLHQRSPPRNHLQSHASEHGVSPRGSQSKSSPAQSAPQQQTNPEFVPSPFDGSPMPCSCCVCHGPRGVPPARTEERPSIDCKCLESEATALRAQSVQSTAPKQAIKETSKEAPKDVSPKEAFQSPSKSPRYGLPFWQVLLVAMGFILFFFAFAILIAHCLAWFLVYKTEARLGEVRSGLLRGGEMKVCLCGRG